MPLDSDMWAVASGAAELFPARAQLSKFPSVLYHYTSMDVLEKITNSRQIWTTNINYLNDTSEYIHARAFIERVLAKRISDDKALRDVVETRIRNLPIVRDRELYLMSLSEVGDSLSQWRGYCSRGRGVAIGFLPKSLKDAANKVALAAALVKCAYTSKEKERSIRLIDEYLGMVKASIERVEFKGTEADADPFLEIMFYQHGMEFKDASFKEEKEWRLVLDYDLAKVKPMRHFRMGLSTLVPYLKVDVGEDYHRTYIKEVVIGPNPQPESAQKSVKMLLREHGLDTVVTGSQIPYRMW